MIKIRHKIVLSLLILLSLLYIPSIARATEKDTVSTGPELVRWMEEHKNTGGTVSLSADITLEDEWDFVPDRPGRPALTVETQGHSITVAGEISFLSDHHLTFRRQAGGKPVFHVREGGMLFLEGAEVVDETADREAVAEDRGFALVQDEGSGLAVSDCPVSGKIRYARTPFVINIRPATVVVEPGQKAADVIPSVIASQVIREGTVHFGEIISVSWELAGTEQMQKDRRRFTVRGRFHGAASLTVPVCTVAYNDFPLTFTSVTAGYSLSSYLFKGCFTKPEGTLPIQVASEYSFDNKNWIQYRVDNVSVMDESFFIGLTKAEWDVSVHPYLYIRLRGSRAGTEYYSNVLRYAADDLDQVVDQGGNRGGGTAVLDPLPKPSAVPEPTPLPASKPTPLPVPEEPAASSVPEEQKSATVSNEPSVKNKEPGRKTKRSAVSPQSVKSVKTVNAGSGAETTQHDLEDKTGKTKTAQSVRRTDLADTMEKTDAGKTAAVLDPARMADDRETASGIPWLVATVLLCAAVIAVLIRYRRTHPD